MEKWTEKDEQTLKSLYEKYDEDKLSIADIKRTHFPSRTIPTCAGRIQQLISIGSLVKRAPKWTEEDDRKLLSRKKGEK